MIDQENMTQEQENIEQVQEQIEEVQNDNSTEQLSQDESVESRKESDQEKNLRALREKTERIERERDEALKKTLEYEKFLRSLQEQQSPKKEDPEEPEYTINPDDLVEGRHLSKYDREIKKLREELKSYQQQSSEYTIEQKLKSQYPDFDSVVNEKTVADLKYADPDLASSIASNPDMYSKAKAAYNAIKRYGIYKEDTYSPDRSKAQENSSKPRPLASVSPQQGDSPLSRANAFANGLTDDLKKQLWAEMQEIRKKS